MSSKWERILHNIVQPMVPTGYQCRVGKNDIQIDVSLSVPVQHIILANGLILAKWRHIAYLDTTLSCFKAAWLPRSSIRQHGKMTFMRRRSAFTEIVDIIGRLPLCALSRPISILQRAEQNPISKDHDLCPSPSTTSVAFWIHRGHQYLPRVTIGDQVLSAKGASFPY